MCGCSQSKREHSLERSLSQYRPVPVEAISSKLRFCDDAVVLFFSSIFGSIFIVVPSSDDSYTVLTSIL